MLYSEVVEKHAPIKHKVLRGNQAPFITRDLSKQIMIRSRLRNKFNEHKTTENWKAYKSQRNKCTSMRRKNIRKHFSTLSNDTGTPTKKFWDSVTPFLSDKVLMEMKTIHLLKMESLSRTRDEFLRFLMTIT